MKTVIFDKTGTLTIGKPIVVGTKLFTSVRLHVFYDTVAAAEVMSLLLLTLLLFSEPCNIYTLVKVVCLFCLVCFVCYIEIS